jgi:hypothetical protein
VPSYLPDEDAWRYPPAPVDRAWRRVAVVAPLVALLVGVAAGLTALQLRSEDAAGRLDDPRVTRVVAQACGVMTSAIGQVRVDGPPRLRGAQLADQNLEVRRMIEQVRTLAPAVRRADRPLEAWLADWEDLLRARERYARQVSGGFRGGFSPPTSPDGEPVVERMDRAASGTCVVPGVVIDPASYRDIAV